MAAAKQLRVVVVAATMVAVVVLRSAFMAEAQAGLNTNREAALNQLDSSQFSHSGVADVITAFASDLQARADYCFLDGYSFLSPLLIISSVFLFFFKGFQLFFFI